MTDIWAHRGASGSAPENTLAAFRLAHELGANGVEFDVHLAADGEVVVIHDETLDRTTNTTGSVHEATSGELAVVHAGSYDGVVQHVPTLNDVLTQVASTGMQVNIELKTDRVAQPGLIEATLDAVAHHQLADRVLFSSFHKPTLIELRRAAPDARIGVLQASTKIGPVRVRPMPWDLAAELAAEAIHPGHREINARLVRRAHQDGRRVHTWTVNDPQRAAELAELGVDVIMTDHPELLLGRN